MDWNAIIEIYAESNHLTVSQVKHEIRTGWIDRDMLFDAWLVYEGIIGYTGSILNVLEEIETHMK